MYLMFALVARTRARCLSYVCAGCQDSGTLSLLTNTTPIFEELESHQVSLGVMQSSSAAGSFLDEVTKWQRRLQSIEGTRSLQGRCGGGCGAD